MANVKTWTYAYNTVPTDQTTAQLQAASLHHQRKEFLVAGGWTVVQSCDGTTYGAGDLLTDLTKYVWSASVGRTWMVLKSPEGFYAGLDGSYTGDQSRMWVTVHLNNANVYNAELYFHNVVPSGTASTTACPTTSTKVGSASQQMTRASFTNTALFHFARNDQGGWFELVSYPPAGYAPWGLLVLPVTEPNRSDVLNKDYPYGVGIYSRFRDSGNGALGENFTTGSPHYPCWLTWGPTGVADPYANISSYMWYSSNWAENRIGSQFVVSGDGFTGKYPASPLWLLSRISNCSLIGKIPDIEYSEAPYAQGDVDGLSPTRVFVGNFLLPTNTTVNL